MTRLQLALALLLPACVSDLAVGVSRLQVGPFEAGVDPGEDDDAGVIVEEPDATAALDANTRDAEPPLDATQGASDASVEAAVDSAVVDASMGEICPEAECFFGLVTMTPSCLPDASVQQCVRPSPELACRWVCY